MDKNLKADLKALTCEGNVASLPTKPLKDYAGLKKVLTKANGKYKKNTFVFPNPAKDVINVLLGGTVVNFKKDFQFFATPQQVAEEMCNQIIGHDSPKVLEPSAGHGSLIDEVLKVRPNAKVTAIELSDLNFSVLKDKYTGNKSVKLKKGDFMEQPNGKYDLIIANPPFTKNQDIDHIMKMYGMLKKDGQLITLASKSWLVGSQKKQVAFKEFVDEEGYYREIQAGAFKESGTNIAVVMIIINK